MDLQIEPKEVNEKIARGEKFVLLDVREPWEHAVSRIEGAVLIPMKQLPERLGAIEEEDDVVVYCHVGIRSIQAAAWFRDQGIESVRSMSGGIDRWSQEVDSAVPRY